MTLWQLAKHQQASVIRLCDQLDSSVMQRLVEMGFEANQSVKCLRRSPFAGPMVIQLGDSVYSLEQQIAEQVHIAEH